MKTQIFLEKKGNFPLKKITWPNYSLLSSMAKLKQQIERVHKVIWQLIWK